MLIKKNLPIIVKANEYMKTQTTSFSLFFWFDLIRNTLPQNKIKIKKK